MGTAQRAQVNWCMHVLPVLWPARQNQQGGRCWGGLGAPQYPIFSRTRARDGFPYHTCTCTWIPTAISSSTLGVTCMFQLFSSFFSLFLPVSLSNVNNTNTTKLTSRV